MKIQQIRNATIKIEYCGKVFLIDPWLENNIQNGKKSPCCELPLSTEEILQDTDICLITHLHYDHYSPQYLPKDIHIVYQNDEDYKIGLEQGFVNCSYFEENVKKFDNIYVRRVNGKHGTTNIHSKLMGNVSGYIFSCEGEKTLYIAGDTVFYGKVKENLKEYQPDIIILNSCDARMFFGRLIMNSNDVISVCKCMPKATIIASHMDTVKHAHMTREQLRQILNSNGYQRQVLIPKDGEILSFS